MGGFLAGESGGFDFVFDDSAASAAIGDQTSVLPPLDSPPLAPIDDVVWTDVVSLTVTSPDPNSPLTYSITDDSLPISPSVSVPEPETLSLLAAGLLAFGVAKRRTRARC